MNPERASRLVMFSSRDTALPGLDEVLDRILQHTWKTNHESPKLAEIQRVVNHVVLVNMMSLATNEKATGQVRAITYSKLNELKDWLKETMEQEMQTGQYALFKYARSQIKLFQKDPEKVKLTIPLKAPMGPPI